MTATNHTANYNLSQFKPTDRPTWQGDYNGDMTKIDAAIHAAASSGGLQEISVSAPLSGKGTSDSPVSIDLGRYATTSALTSGLAGKVNKTASAPESKGLTAQQLDSLWLDGDGIVRFKA